MRTPVPLHIKADRPVRHVTAKNAFSTSLRSSITHPARDGMECERGLPHAVLLDDAVIHEGRGFHAAAGARFLCSNKARLSNWVRSSIWVRRVKALAACVPAARGTVPVT